MLKHLKGVEIWKLAEVQAPRAHWKSICDLFLAASVAASCQCSLNQLWSRKGCTVPGSGLFLPPAVTLPCRDRFVSRFEPTGFCYDPLHAAIMKRVFVALLLIPGTDRGVLHPSPSLMHHFSTNPLRASLHHRGHSWPALVLAAVVAR